MPANSSLSLCALHADGSAVSSKKSRPPILLPVSSQYIFTMHRLSKLHPPSKTVLDNVTLAFYPGAKIGVLGYNGSG